MLAKNKQVYKNSKMNEDKSDEVKSMDTENKSKEVGNVNKKLFGVYMVDENKELELQKIKRMTEDGYYRRKMEIGGRGVGFLSEKYANNLDIMVSFKELSEGTKFSGMLDTRAMRKKFLKARGLEKEEIAAVIDRCDVILIGLTVYRIKSDFPCDLIGTSNMIFDLPEIDGTERYGISIEADTDTNPNRKYNKRVTEMFQKDEFFRKEINYLSPLSRESLKYLGTFQSKESSTYDTDVWTFPQSSQFITIVRKFPDQLMDKDLKIDTDGRVHYPTKDFENSNKWIEKEKRKIPVGRNIVMNFEKRSGKKWNDLTDLDLSKEEMENANFKEGIEMKKYKLHIEYEVEVIFVDTR
jgi:hypothetical protein